jgi:hypothetical protein
MSQLSRLSRPVNGENLNPKRPSETPFIAQTPLGADPLVRVGTFPKLTIEIGFVEFQRRFFQGHQKSYATARLPI